MAKIVFAAALVALVISRVHWADYADPQGGPVRRGMASAIQDLNWPFALAACACILISSVAGAMRMRLMLSVQKVPISPGQAIKLIFLGDFFSNILLGNVGGDIVKAYTIGRSTDRKPHMLVGMFVDRTLGVTILILMAATALIGARATGMLSVKELQKPALSVAVVGGLAVVGVALAFSRSVRRTLGLQKIYSRLPFVKQIAAAGDALQTCRQAVWELVAGAALALTSQLLTVSAAALIGAGLGLPIDWYEYLLYIPLIQIVAAVPITPGGIGVVEGAFLVYFAAVGDDSSVLTLALLWRMVSVTCSLPGAVIAAVGPKLPRADQMRAALETEAAGPGDK